MDKNLSLPQEAFSSAELFEELADAVFRWGIEKKLTSANGVSAIKQIKKLKEEVNELKDALEKQSEEDVLLEAGDVLVVLMNICRLRGFDLVEALRRTYIKISQRKGEIKDGVFVKE